jgi:hypothetical protein
MWRRHGRLADASVEASADAVADVLDAGLTVVPDACGDAFDPA